MEVQCCQMRDVRWRRRAVKSGEKAVRVSYSCFVIALVSCFVIKDACVMLVVLLSSGGRGGARDGDGMLRIVLRLVVNFMLLFVGMTMAIGGDGDDCDAGDDALIWC